MLELDWHIKTLIYAKTSKDNSAVETIAARLGRTPKAVESLLSRAREQVRGLLAGYTMPCGDGRRVSKESSNE